MFQTLLVIALCVDAFSASVAYGINQTKIPFASAAVISAVCTFMLLLSILIGSAAKAFIPITLSQWICFGILLVLGVVKSFESILKSFILKKQTRKDLIKWKLFDINFVITVYADNIQADCDRSKILSSKEAVYLALALSLDGFAAGFGSGLVDINYLYIAVLSLFSNMFFIFLGYLCGKSLARISKFDFSWIGGLLLIFLAFIKIL